MTFDAWTEARDKEEATGVAGVTSAALLSFRVENGREFYSEATEDVELLLRLGLPADTTSKRTLLSPVSLRSRSTRSSLTVVVVADALTFLPFLASCWF